MAGNVLWNMSSSRIEVRSKLTITYFKLFVCNSLSISDASTEELFLMAATPVHMAFLSPRCQKMGKEEISLGLARDHSCVIPVAISQVLSL